MNPLYDTIGLNYADLRRPDKAEWNKVREAFADIYDVIFAEFGDRVPDAWRAA